MKLISSRDIVEKDWRNACGGNTTVVADDVLGSSLVLGGDDGWNYGKGKLKKKCTKISLRSLIS